MAEVWPFDEYRRRASAPREAVHPFRCVLLMPIGGRFDPVANVLERTVRRVVEGLGAAFGPELPIIRRVDWITASAAIQEDIWGDIAAADIVFCDITGYNANVMFEAGVAAAWKRLSRVVLIKDRFFGQPPAFDIAPIRYIEYEITSDGVPKFEQRIVQLVTDAVVSLPDEEADSRQATFPFSVDFSDGRDDDRLYTPPFAHRRVTDCMLEFGSRTHYAHSWASLGRSRLLHIDVDATLLFRNRVPGMGFIGVGFRSQHFYANFTHMVYLNHEGKVILVQPTETAPKFYEDILLHTFQSIDFDADHHFHVRMDAVALAITVDGFQTVRAVGEMPKVLGAGAVRFQTHSTWMGIRRLHVESLS